MSTKKDFKVNKRLINNLLSGFCCLCLQKSDRCLDLCIACEQDLALNQARCYNCGSVLTGITPNGTAETRLNCGKCISKKPLFDSLITNLSFSFPLDSLIRDFKYKNHFAYGNMLSKLLISKIELSTSLPQAIIPIPLHANRQKHRGFNQAERIASQIGRHIKRPVLLNSCRRIKNTDSQTGLNLNERKRNLSGAFQLSINDEPFPYSHIALVDDVVTTGSTCNSLAKLFKDFGVSRIDVYCLARATQHY